MHGYEQIAQRLHVSFDSHAEALAMLDDCVISGAELRDVLLSARELSRQVELLTVKLVREMVQRGEFDPDKRNDFNNLLHAGRFRRAELKSCVRLAEELFERPVSVDQPEPVPARMPQTAAGFESFDYGTDSAMEIAKVLDQVPEGTPARTVAQVEGMLAALAATLAPEDLRKAGLRILQGLNAEHPPSDADRQRKRSIKVSPQGTDLMARISGAVTPQLKALLDRLFADYAGPGDLLPEGEKEGDTRTADQRRHDALVAALTAALHRNGPMPPTRGCSTVVATMTLEQLRRAAGIVQTDVGTLMPISDLIRLGADKNAFLAILEEGTGNLIELGRTKRAADVYAYLGLVASQGSDTTPGSDLPAALCEIHHWTSWQDGGLSTAGNMGLVGHRTHRDIDDSKTNPHKYWTICDETGQMLWVPPDKIDPERRPRANFNPITWFNPGYQVRYGMHMPDECPPFQTLVCQHCGEKFAA